MTGSRTVPFSRELWIERDDFMEDPPKKFFRLAPGREVRLRYGYFITCTDVVKDASGKVVELRCTYDPATRGGDAPDGRKVQGTIHWVSARHALDCELRLYDRLFTVPDPGRRAGGQDFTSALNPESLVVVPGPRSSRAWRTTRRARATSSSGRATSSAIRWILGRRAGVQPDGGAAGLLGEGQGQVARWCVGPGHTKRPGSILGASCLVVPARSSLAATLAAGCHTDPDGSARTRASGPARLKRARVPSHARPTARAPGPTRTIVITAAAIASDIPPSSRIRCSSTITMPSAT